MNTLARLGNYFFVIFSVSVYAVPPEACFANFRWDDCGKPAVPVMYYWKSGSRCEVALWRGCLPNPNMFPDEYSCINTCVFVQRADPYDMSVVKGDETDPIIEIAADADATEAVNDVDTSPKDDDSSTTDGVSNDGSVNTTGDSSAVTGEPTGDTGNGTVEGTGDASNNTIDSGS